MAFSYTVTKPKTNIGGGLRVVFGTYTDAAADGSNIVTGLHKVFMCMQSPVQQICMGCKESTTAGTITVYAANDGTDDGGWFAIGQ
jgi:hypothetical protein